MRLSQIKLAGFKSFVDPTVLSFPTNLTGVVGPNGCGKSNVIDAVRWVMGESSAKYLRGDSLADVIFNGSSARKPVGVASIELVFDNGDGAIGGQYGAFSEVSVKRTLSRDGVSVYSINGTRCRRRDITGIFLGTGLGPRSYSIIQQGMVSRLIEARPEDMRAYLEEAAGISRYKDKRRETENRIRHTRENLERLTDLRDEVDKQLKHLQRQARVAERFKEYREREHKLQAELALLRLRELDAAHEQQHLQVEQHRVAVEAALADQRSVEAQIEEARERQAERQEEANEAQETFFKHGAEMARIEQEISHARDLTERQGAELERLARAIEQVRGDIAADEAQLDAGAEELQSLTPALDAARQEEQASGELVQRAQGERADWQYRWDEYSEKASAAARAVSVEATRLEGLEVRSEAMRQRADRLETLRASLSVAELEGDAQQAASAVAVAHNTLSQRQDDLREATARVERWRAQQSSVDTQLHDVRGELESVNGQVASLEALQQAALGTDAQSASLQWLNQGGLRNNPRLAQQLQVQPGWEGAVEAVLGEGLQAVCVKDLAELARLGGLPRGERLALFQPGSAPPAFNPGAHGLQPLASQLGGAVVPSSLLAGIYCAEDLASALAQQPHLAAGESIITRTGEWLGQDWLRLGDSADPRAGVIAREQLLRERREQQQSLSEQRAALEEQAAHLRDELETGERQRVAQQEAVNAAHSLVAEGRGRVDALASRLDQMREQLQSVEGELAELGEQRREIAREVEQCRARGDAAARDQETLSDQESDLRHQREHIDQRLQRATECANADRAKAQGLALQVEARSSQQRSLKDAMARLQQQLAQYQGRSTALREQMEHEAAPVRDLEHSLEALLESRGGLERALTQARERVEATETEQRQLQTKRNEHEAEVDQARTALESQRLLMQEIVTRRSTCSEAFERLETTAEAIAGQMDAELTIASGEDELEKIERRIQRLGPINLAAIDEFQTQCERKEYLDAQHTDLEQALETLEGAMRKIDRETRTRFKETFDRVDAGLKSIFPRLFGGGHAYLELSDDDLLAAGVTVMARPPGKRNSTIHLLSGGEKAMTAVALIFAIFELNPAPFCMLDEVDAPLDEANVGRFCEIVREMSERVQFIFITHNKTTMELASHLSGVTMQEPGVSRLVAVDVDEAVKLAAM
ncbi:MAG: chromosome segregation protein SMC [Pseudomonadota bacterium]